MTSRWDACQKTYENEHGRGPNYNNGLTKKNIPEKGNPDKKETTCQRTNWVDVSSDNKIRDAVSEGSSDDTAATPQNNMC